MAETQDAPPVEWSKIVLGIPALILLFAVCQSLARIALWLISAVAGMWPVQIDGILKVVLDESAAGVAGMWGAAYLFQQLAKYKFDTQNAAVGITAFLLCGFGFTLLFQAYEMGSLSLVSGVGLGAFIAGIIAGACMHVYEIA